MATRDCDVLVVGAGVSGLTTAICLAEAGMRVLVTAKSPPQETTSSVAGAIWGPHLVEDSERAARWRRQTLTVLRDLAAEPGTGVRIVTGVEAVRSPAPDQTAGPDMPAEPGTTTGLGPPPGLGTPPAEPDAPGTPAIPPAPESAGKFGELGGFEQCEAADLPPGFAAGWRFAAPLAHMPTYLQYLVGRFEGIGGRITVGTVASLPAAARDCGAGVVANCTGIGARELMRDPELVSVRGQVVLTTNPGLTEFFIGHASETGELVYILPHEDTVLLGGTDAVGDWSLDPYPAVAERILRDARAVDGRLGDARVLAHRVGLRPVRPTVRLAADRPATAGDGPVVVHNYGHGGAGVTLSWGCAREAAGLIVGLGA